MVITYLLECDLCGREINGVDEEFITDREGLHICNHCYNEEV